MKIKADREIEAMLETLIQRDDDARHEAAQAFENYSVAAFCYNRGRGKWVDVFNVVLQDNQAYLIRRVTWKTMARRAVEHADRPALARWSTNGPWQVLYGYLRITTASLDGIQVYVQS